MNTMKKRNPYRTGALLALLALLQGCATLDKDECMLADWRMIGYEDGVAGRSANRVGEYRKDCAKHAVTPDLEAYRAGREEGLQQYCKVDNGYRLGNAGRGLSAVCPAALQAEFRDAYQAGRKLYLARSAVNNTSARINERRNTLTTLEKNRAQKLASLIADGLQSEQRLMILYDISELQQEMNDVEAEIVDLEYDLEDKQAHLEQLSQNSRY